MRKMFAFLMALAMTVQLVMPAWADVAQEETAETVATEEAQGATEEAAEEPTEEVPEETEGETSEGTEAAAEETVEETTEAVEETTEPESAPTEAPAAKVRVRFVCTPENLTLVVYPADGDVDQAIEAEADGSYLLAAGEYTYLAGAEGYVSVEDRFTVADEECQVEVALEIADAVDGVEALAAGVVASGTCGENLTWELGGDGTLRISGKGEMADYTYDDKAPWDTYRSQVTAIVLEDGVTNIGDYAFYFCNSATDVTIPDSVTGIGEDAFCGCRDLTSVTIPNSVTNIGDDAFSWCSSLTSVTIPDSVTNIGDRAFYFCTRLSGIFVDDGNANYASVDGVLFNKELSVIIFYPAGHGSVYRIPEGVTSIGSHAFEDCSSLTDVTIPEGVTSIGDSAFYNCSSLTSMTIPDGVTSIAHWGFFSCESLTSVTIPVSVTSIGSSAFYNCTALKDIYYGGSLTAIKRITSNASIPQGCTLHGATSDLDNGACGENLTWALSADGVLTISGSGEMEACRDSYSRAPWYTLKEKITTVVLEAGVTSVGNNAFRDCSSLTSVAMPESMASIGDYAFYNCTNLASVTIPEGVSSICNSAFKGCSDLTDVTIPESVTSIGNSAFNDCCGLISVIIPKGVMSIGDNAFDGCSGLTSVTIPESVISIGSYAFSNCNSLTSVTIPKSVTNIGGSVFESCGKLVSVRYSGSNSDWRKVKIEGWNVELVEKLVYEDLQDHGSYENLYWTLEQNGVLTITGYGTVPKQAPWYPYRRQITTVILNSSVGESAFLDYSNLSNVTMQDGVTDIGEEAFKGCGSLISITLPKSVTSIGRYAFYSCDALKDIYYGGSLRTLKRISEYAGLLSTCNLHGVTLGDGICGDSIAWELGFDGILTISGDGKMEDYSFVSNIPWSSISSEILSVRIEQGVTSIGAHAFSNCSSLMNVSIPDTVTSIGSYAFSDCSSLTKVIIPEAVRGIASYVFSGCSSLAEVEMPEELTRIGFCAFLNCGLLDNLTIPKRVMSIDSSAFSGCNALKDIYYDGSRSKLEELVRYADIPSDCNFHVLSLADGRCGENLTWVLSEKGVLSILGYGEMWDFNVDSNNNSIPWKNYRSRINAVQINTGVTSIGRYAFYGCSSLTSADIPKGVTKIAKLAFGGCSGLEEVTLPDGVLDISDAFNQCTSLKKITIQSGVTYIEQETFKGCRSLTNLTIPKTVRSISSNAFSDCSNLKEIYYGGSLNTLKQIIKGTGVPSECNLVGETLADGSCGSSLYWALGHDGVLTISGSGAIGDYNVYTNSMWGRWSTQILSVVMKPGVTRIGNRAFSDCSNVTDLVIPNGVTSIGEGAFRNCEKLVDVTIPDSVTSIGMYAFCDCAKLKSVIIPDKVASIETSTFSGCRSLISVTIPKHVTSIKYGAFYDCGTISIYYGGSHADWEKIEIGNESFYRSTTAITYGDLSDGGICGDLNWALDQNGVLTISGSGSMGNQSPWMPYRKQITAITLNPGMTDISEGAFSGCSGLTDVVIPKGVTKIGREAFYNCLNLERAVLPDGLVCIESAGYNDRGNYCGGAFEKCTSLTKIIVPDSVTSIGAGAFCGCKNLTNITIPAGITSIENGSFAECGSLTDVTIPDGVNSIGDGAFMGCEGLTKVLIPDSLISIGNNAFESCVNLSDVVFSDSVISIGDAAFSGCGSLTSLEIPLSVTGIGSKAFSQCAELKSISYSGSLSTLERLLQNADVSATCELRSATLADGTCGNNLTWVLGHDGVLAISGSGIMENYSFTRQNETYLTTAPWGNYCNQITAVQVEPGVTAIGTFAFSGCKSIGNVFIPEGITLIPGGAFYGCVNLESVTLPDGLTSIERYYDNSYSWGAFENCFGLKSVDMPNCLTSIGVMAFNNCSSLTSLTIPKSVTYIGGKAFSGCTALKDIYYDGSVGALKRLTYNADITSDCNLHGTSLDNGTCGDNLTWILGLDGILTISGSGEMENYDYRSVAPWYSKRNEIQSVVVEPGVTSIGSFAFPSYSRLVAVTFPESVVSIGMCAFRDCNNLTDVTLPRNVTKIAGGTFYNCDKLESVTLPEELQSIESNYEYGAFEECNSLKSITIPNSTQSIGRKAFKGCRSLSNVVLSRSMSSICSSAFSDCSSLTSITIPVGVTRIEDDAFCNCRNLTEITFEHRGRDTLSVSSSAFRFEYGTSTPVFTIVHIPAIKTIHPAIKNCWNWNGSREVGFVGDKQINTESVSVATKSNTVQFELGVPVQFTVVPVPIDSTDDYTLTIVQEKTTADAYISKDGILTTLSTGIVTVRAQCVQNPAISDEITVTILQPTAALTSLTVTTLNDYPGDAEVGKPVQMVPVFTPANAAERTVTWSVENGTGTATIDENGLLTPLTVGTVTVYAMTPDGVEGSCTVNIVRYAEEVTILLNGKEDISGFGVGENLELSFRLSPEDTTTKEVVWSVTNRTGWAKLYTGDNNNRLYGTLEGKQAGTVILTVTAKDSKKVIATKELTITDSIRSYALSDGSGNLYYNTETGWITGADENVKDVVIPAQIDDVKIVGIAPYVFADRRSSWVNENKTLRSVSIPASVEEIGESAFEQCTALSTLRFAPGSKLTTVGENAFSQCSSITTLTIPDGARTIGKNAFAGLSSLKRLTMSGEVDGSAWFGDRWFSLDSLTLTGTYVVGGKAEDDDYNWAAVPPGRNAKKVVLSEGITKIGDRAFTGCGTIKEIVLPSSLKSIGICAFASCSGLTDVTLPDGLETIGLYAFRRCGNLTNVNLPNSIQSIGEKCFDDCEKLEIFEISNVPDVILEKKTYLTGMAKIPEVLIRATNGKTEIKWELYNIENGYYESLGWDRQTKQYYIIARDSGTYRLICEDTYTGARGSKLIEIKTGTLIRPSDTGYLVSGSKLALSAWSMPEEKKTSVWWSLAEGGSNYASIDSKGVLTARTVYSAQQVTVIAQPYDGSEQVTKTIWILPKTTGLGLLLDGGPLGSTLNVDQAQTKTLQLSAKVYPDGALQEVSWSSSNESVARVDETGLVTLAKPGTVVIQAATKDGSKLTAQVTLNVTYLDANSKLTLVGEVPQPGLEPGQTVQLTLWGEAAIEAENVVFSVPSNQSAMGSIDGSGLFTAGSTAGNVTVTAALKDDPLGRSASITIPVLPMQAHTVLAVPVLDGVGQVTQRDGIYEAIFRQTEVEGGYRFRLRVQAQNYQGQPLSGKFVYTTTDASIAKVSADGLVTVQKGAEGLCAIGVRAADALGTGTEVWVSVRDYSPRLETNKLTVNSALEEGCSLVLAASYGNDIENVFLSDGRFSCSWEEDKLTISAKESLKNGTYPMTLEVVCADNMYKYTLFVKVTKTLPKVTVKQTEKFNLFYQDSSAELKINVAGNLPFNYEFRDNTDFRLDIFDDEARLYFADPQNAPAKPDTKATLRLWLEGYREPVDVKLSIATVNKGPKVTTAVKASTLNTALTTSNTLRVRLNDPEPGSMEAWSGTEGIEAVIDGCDLCLTLSEVKNTTATVYLRDTNWAQPIKLTHKITVTDKLPTLKAASALKLDSLFTQTEAWTELVLSQGNLSLVTAELTPAAKKGTAAKEESDKLSVTYDPDACLIVARIADPDKAPKAGTYSFNCTGILENGGEIPGGVVKVTVVAAKPKVKLSASSVKLNKALNGWERAEIPVTVTGNNRVVDFEGLPEGMTYNEDTGKLTVMLSEETASGGSYGLCPVVESNETGQRAKLPTKVSFKVQVYTSDKLAVSLSAKGKLNTLDPESSIAYTVTKVSNCLNPVEGVSLDGTDGDKFQVELDTTSAKPVVRLQMLPGQSYATNVGYKVQFRFFVADREVLSPMQTVKLTQAALKVTAPKSLVYFQAQTGTLRFSLAANAPIGEVALSAKTAPELLTALGEDGLRFDGSQLELSVTNPAALKAGKSYTLQLEVTPEYNAENVKPTLVKLTVKVMK